MAAATILLILLGLICLVGLLIFLFRCMSQGKACQTRARIDDKTVLISDADTKIGIELVRELCRRGARVIMAVKDVELGQDVAVEVKGETNGEIVVEYCDMSSLKSVRDFCTKVIYASSQGI